MTMLNCKLIGIVLIVGIVSFFPVTAMTLEAPPAPVEKKVLTIKDKNQDGFIVKEQQFIVTAKTDIRNYDNKKISFKSLWIPCIAEVVYQMTNDNKAVCLKLKVKSSLKRDSTNKEN